MARKVYFSYKCLDATRAAIVRDCWLTPGNEAAGFIQAADIDKVARHGDASIQQWIDEEIDGTSVTVVLVGEHTCSSQWVQHEIEKSIALGNGMLGIDISMIPDPDGNVAGLCGKIPTGYPFYVWDRDGGAINIGAWIDQAASAAGR